MSRHTKLGFLVVLALCLLPVVLLVPAAGQDAELEIRARARVLPDVGPGLIALKRDAAGRYFVAASPANQVSIFSAEGKRVGQIPGASSQDATKNAKIVFAADFDVDSAGRILVADRGANAIKIFSADGSLAITIPFAAPTSIAALPGDEFAATSLRYKWLLAIYGDNGKLTRAFGEPHDFFAGFDSSRTPDLGRVSSDPAGNLYFVFSFLPVPTMRRFDRFGYAGNEISLDEFAPNSTRRDLLSLDRRDTSQAKPQINALGVDPLTQEIWLAVGGDLLRFESLGARLGAYHTLSPSGAPLVPKTILVEKDRLLIGTDSFGVFDFAKPAKIPARSSAH
jgi:hypothetical protein